MSVAGVHVCVRVGAPVAVVVVVVWRRGMRRRQLRTSVGMIVGVHGCKGAGGQLGGGSATHSAHLSTRKSAATIRTRGRGRGGQMGLLKQRKRSDYQIFKQRKIIPALATQFCATADFWWLSRGKPRKSRWHWHVKINVGTLSVLKSTAFSSGTYIYKLLLLSVS